MHLSMDSVDRKLLSSLKGCFVDSLRTKLRLWLLTKWPIGQSYTLYEGCSPNWYARADTVQSFLPLLHIQFFHAVVRYIRELRIQGKISRC